MGRMTEKEARTHPRRNVLTDCVGGSRPSIPVAEIGRMKRYATYLLGSDGLVHETSKLELAYRLSPWKCGSILALREGVAQLTKLVRQRGETDDITAVGMFAAGSYFRRKAAVNMEVGKPPFLLVDKLVVFDDRKVVMETTGEESDGERENIDTGDGG